MGNLDLRFLGLFSVSEGGLPIIGFESNKVRGLLAYLAVEAARPHAREMLAGLLWPEWPDSAARSNLRYALADLRKVIRDAEANPPILQITRDAIQFNNGSHHCLDVAEFDRLSANRNGVEAVEERIRRLEGALALHQGEFLEGFTLPEAAPFEEWARLKREQIHRQYLQVLSDLAAACEQQGDLAKAMSYARRQVEIEPWQEEAQRQLIRLLAIAGQRSAALAQYEACVRTLAAELQVEPSYETKRLVESIRDGTLEAHAGAPEALEELPPAPGVAPFMGLQFFDEVDAGLYFGRETLTAHLVGHLRELGEERFLAVVGASGSGKSSLVRAGLIPAIRKTDPLADGSFPPRWSHRWLVHVITPTAHPLEALATSLTRDAASVSTTAALIDDMERDPRSLHLYALRLTHVRNAPRLLLVVDQFEELFTLCRSEGEREAFIENLLVAAGVEPPADTPPGELSAAQGLPSPSGQEGPLLAVITLRADFYDHCAQYAGLRNALSARQEYIGPMSTEELRRAIEEPARRNDWEFGPGLVDLILREVNDAPGGLPLLSHALLETWHRRRGRTLILKGYTEAGGIHRAIAQTAESVYTSLPEEKRNLAQRIFLRLTELGEGTQDTRRRATLNELAPSSDTAPQIEAVLNTLVEARLVTTGEGMVEVAHEALIREWQRLHDWLSQDREGLRLHRRLTDSALEWEARGHDPAELYRGARLAQMSEWASANEERLNPAEHAYIAASITQEQQTAMEREAQRQRELEAARHLAETKSQSEIRLRARNRIITGVGVITLLLAVLAGMFALSSNQNARKAQASSASADQQAATAVAARGEAEHLVVLRSRDAQVNHSLALAAQSRLVLQANNLDLALALAMEANRIPNPPGLAQMALSEAAYAPGTVRVFLGHQALVSSVAVSPDGRYGLSGDEKGVAILWDLDTGEALRRLEGHKDKITRLVFTPDGRHAISASRDKTLIYWDLDNGKMIYQLTGHQDGVNTVAISPDGRLAASGSGRAAGDPTSAKDNSLRLWNLQSGQEIQRFELFTDSVSDVSFTPDGRKLAVGTETDGLMLVDIQTGKVLLRPGVPGDIAQVGVTQGGNFALTADGNYQVYMWNLRTGEMVKHLTGSNAGLDGLAVTPDGKRALSSSFIAVNEYDLDSGEQINHFDYGASAIALRPDGRAALIGSSDNTVRLIALDSGAEIGRLPAGNDFIRGAAYDPHGQSVMTDDTGHLYRWDLATGKNIWNAVSGDVWPLVLSPDGSQILAGAVNGGWAGLWNAVTGKELKHLKSDGSFEGLTPGAEVDGVAFDPSGKFALTGAQEGTAISLIYWNLETAKPVWLFDTSKRQVYGVAISPDGRTALSGEIGGVVEWWDLATGKLIRSLKGHTNLVWSVAFVDNQTAISASEDSTMILWDLKSGTALRSFLGHASGIKQVVVSPDKRLALSVSRDKTAILWDIKSGEPLRHYIGHTDQLMTAAWHPGGGEVLTGGRDNQAIRWRIDADLDTLMYWVKQNRYVRPLTCAERDAFNIEPLCAGGSELAAPEPFNTPPPSVKTQIALLPPLSTPTPILSAPTPAPAAAVAAGAAVWGVNHGSVPPGGGQVWEYSGAAGDRLSIRIAADMPVNRTWGLERKRDSGLLDPTVVVYKPDGSVLARADDLENGIATDAYLASLKLPQTGIYRIEVRGYQDQTSGSYRLILADPRLLVLKAGLSVTAGLAIYPDGRRVLVGVDQPDLPPDAVSGSHSIWVWDLASGEVVQKLAGHENTVVALAVSPDGRRALSADANGIAILWNLESGKEILRFDNQGVGFNDVHFLPDGQTALTTSNDVALWDLTSGKAIRHFEGNSRWVNNVVLSPDGRTMYSTSDDNTVHLWSIATGKLIATYKPFADGLINGLAINPDGSKLLVGRAFDDNEPIEPRNGAIALLDAKTGETLLNLEGHTAEVVSIAFSPDGRYALSGSKDRTVRLWEVSTGKQLAVFTGHTDSINHVAFSPDGTTGYSTGEDGSIRVWDLRDFIGRVGQH